MIYFECLQIIVSIDMKIVLERVLYAFLGCFCVCE